MANINVKDILAKLSFFKNNLSLLVPIIIVLVALLLFVPTRILASRLGKTMSESASMAKTIKSLNEGLPEAAKVEQIRPYIDARARDANQIDNLIKQTTQRELLSYRLFPDTNERTSLLFDEFSRSYRSGVDGMLQGLKAGVPPTMAEISTALKKAPKEMMGGMYGDGYGMYGGGMAGGRPGASTGGMNSLYGGQAMGGLSTMAMTDAQYKIFDTLCRERARNAGVYVGPTDIAGYLYWDEWKYTDRDSAYKDCWYWQLGYWMIDDVLATAREMNKNSTSVLDAPVKRIMNVSFVFTQTMGRSMRRVGRATGRGGKKTGDNPVYVIVAKDAMTTPCTGRLSGETFDVMQFEVRVVVDSKSALAFMKQLCTAKEHKFAGWKGDQPKQTFQHNQITILESTQSPVDPENWQHNTYRYGDAQVAELDLICEYLFIRAAYDGIKPKQVTDDVAAALEAGTKKKK